MRRGQENKAAVGYLGETLASPTVLAERSDRPARPLWLERVGSLRLRGHPPGVRHIVVHARREIIPWLNRTARSSLSWST